MCVCSWCLVKGLNGLAGVQVKPCLCWSGTERLATFQKIGVKAGDDGRNRQATVRCTKAGLGSPELTGGGVPEGAVALSMGEVARQRLAIPCCTAGSISQHRKEEGQVQ